MENRRNGRHVTNNAYETAIRLESLFQKTMGLLIRLGHRLPQMKEFINPSQMRIMQAVYIEDRPIGMSSLASKLGLTKGTLTSTIKPLIRMGYLARARADLDDRVVNISLTQAGKGKLQKMQRYLVGIFLRICKEITEDERRKLLDSQQIILDTYVKVETRLTKLD